MMRRLSLAVLMAILFADSAPAQVQIDPVAGEFQTGVPLTITGSGFGTKEFSSPWLWDDLTGAVYQGLQDGAWIPSREGNSYGFSDTSPDVIDPESYYKNTTGWPAFRTTHPQRRIEGRPVISCEGTGATLFDIGRPHGDQEFLYLDFWYYSTSCRSDPLVGVPGENYNKIFRLSPSTETYNTYGHTSVYPARVSFDRWADDPIGYVVGDTYPTEGEWHHISVWTDGSGNMSGIPGESEGVLQIWTDNQLKIDVHDEGYNTWPVPDDVKGYSFVHAIGIETAGGSSDHSPPDANLWSDIYIDNTLSRVALGDGPTWPQVRHFELQIPRAWQPDAIEVTANLGSFTASDYLWLYVFDAQGNPNPEGVLVQEGDYSLDAPGLPVKPVYVGD